MMFWIWNLWFLCRIFFVDEYWGLNIYRFVMSFNEWLKNVFLWLEFFLCVGKGFESVVFISLVGVLKLGCF